MRFLIDNALPPKLAELLVAAGHEAIHVRSYGMHDRPDGDILQRARTEERVVVSADTDFGVLLAAQATTRPSFILFREPNLLRAEDYFELLVGAVDAPEAEVEAACVAVFRSGRLRVRKLPLSE